jgi:predicted alpha/beta superfamily hydrolase
MIARMIVAALIMVAMIEGPAVAQVSSGRLVKIVAYPSAHVQPRMVTIWLPAEYDAQPRRRFPVIYMHDGQNLFEKATSNFGEEWGVDEAVTRLAARGKLRPSVIVGMASTPARYHEYMPRKVYDLLPDAYKAAVRETQSGEPVSDAYLRFIVEELKPHIDREYRTLTGPADTSIMGSSMGGLISLYAMAEYPQVFGQAACISTHYVLVGASGAAATAPDAPQLVAETFRRYLATSAMKPGANRLYMDHGTATLDQFYPPFAAEFDIMMVKAGWSDPRYWESRTFTGTAHNEQAWRERVDIPLLFLDRDGKR